jgi:hypothetical protein
MRRQGSYQFIERERPENAHPVFALVTLFVTPGAGFALRGLAKSLILLGGVEGLEPPTPWF